MHLHLQIKGYESNFELIMLWKNFEITVKFLNFGKKFRFRTSTNGDLCIKVTFADREEDLIVADEYHTKENANHDVYKGKLKNDATNAKVVVVLSQDPKVKDLIVFKSNKVPGCRKYRVSLKVNCFFIWCHSF